MGMRTVEVTVRLKTWHTDQTSPGQTAMEHQRNICVCWRMFDWCVFVCVYINNITPTQTYDIRFYADETLLYARGSSPTQTTLQSLTCTECWWDNMYFILKKPYIYLASPCQPHTYSYGTELILMLFNLTNIRGVWSDSSLTFKPHVDQLAQNVKIKMFLISE